MHASGAISQQHVAFIMCVHTLMTACTFMENKPFRSRNNSTLGPPGEVILTCVQSIAPTTPEISPSLQNGCFNYRQNFQVIWKMDDSILQIRYGMQYYITERRLGYATHIGTCQLKWTHCIKSQYNQKMLQMYSIARNYRINTYVEVVMFENGRIFIACCFIIKNRYSLWKSSHSTSTMSTVILITNPWYNLLPIPGYEV